MDDYDYSPALQPVESLPDVKDVKSTATGGSKTLQSSSLSQVSTLSPSLSKFSVKCIHGSSIPKIILSKEDELVRDFCRAELLKLESRSRPGREHKVYADSADNLTNTWNGSAISYDLLTIAQGSDQATRTGNTIAIKKIVIRVSVWQPSNLTAISAGPYVPSELTMLVLRDKVPLNPGVIPTPFATTSFPSTDGTAVYIRDVAPTYRDAYIRNTNTLQQYEVYHRDHHKLKSPLQFGINSTGTDVFVNGGWHKHWKYEVPLHGLRVQYKTSSASNTVLTNALWFYMAFDTPSSINGYANASYQITSETVFDDCLE